MRRAGRDDHGVVSGMHDADMAAEVQLQTPAQDTQRLISVVLVCRFRVP